MTGPEQKSIDEVHAYLESLPRLGLSDHFSFGCGPKQACFNECCRYLELVLSPYDVLRLLQSVDLSSGEFLKKYCQVAMEPESGLPVVMLMMEKGLAQKCPFVSDEGCTVYENRPAACRIYPLGRGAQIDEDGRLSVQYVLQQEDVCRGFEKGRDWTVEEWTADQKVAIYDDFSDRYLAFVNKQKKRKLKVPPEKFGIVVMALYQQDVFKKYIQKKEILKTQKLTGAEKQQILDDLAKRLLFAFNWLDGFLLFSGGSCQV